MKCKGCNKRMSDILIDFDYQCNSVIKKAVNVPAYQCPLCNNVIVPDMILARLKGFALQERDSVVDFAKYQQQEEDDYVVLHMLGMM